MKNCWSNKNLTLIRKTGKFESPDAERRMAHNLIYKITKKKVSYLKTGRPIIGERLDVSISHKKNVVFVGIVYDDFKIGIDVEDLSVNINYNLFIKQFISKKELDVINKFCSKHNMSLSRGVIILWSLKEAFFKGIDENFLPRRVSVINMDDLNNILIKISLPLRAAMRKKRQLICGVKIEFEYDFVYSCVLIAYK